MAMGSVDKSGKVPVTAPPQQTVATRRQVADKADAELAGEKAGDSRTEVGAKLHTEKIDEIRRKIESGFYERDDVRKMIAERLGADIRGRRE